MIRLTNLADYGVVIMGALCASGERLNAKELASTVGLPAPTVSKVLNALNRANLIVSHRGLKGGFALADQAENIPVAAIIEAIDGRIALTHCSDPEGVTCDLDQICRMRAPWQKINVAVRRALMDISLADLMGDDTPTLTLGNALDDAPNAQAHETV